MAAQKELAPTHAVWRNSWLLDGGEKEEKGRERKTEELDTVCDMQVKTKANLYPMIDAKPSGKNEGEMP